MPVLCWNNRSGCLLPFLIFFNLFFGWMIFKPVMLWLLIGLGLFFLFILQSCFVFKSFVSKAAPKNKNIINIEAEVLKDN